ncbi:unnamed protein product [Pieris macdunnoughi]|uniref:Mevalonate kinase n=1 Tax=Pieris macdunnoughi TaxID=345717 RepID=A0A821PH22_9NEOP|nr:unnamed protein product [Pieris macdunnoughi]
MNFSVSAPGKVILHGEHSVVFGKTAIAVSLGLRTTAYLKETSNTFININLPSVLVKESVQLHHINTEILSYKSYIEHPQSIPHEEHLIKTEIFVKNTFPNFDNFSGKQKNALIAIFYVFFGVFGGKEIRGFEISFVSDLTIGAGTGSSASFAVCLAAALLRFAKGSNESIINFEEKQLISQWAYNCERIMHGTPSGIDNTTATFGSLVVFCRGQKPNLLDLKLNLRILLVDTQVSRQTQVLAQKVRGLMGRNPEAVDCVMTAMDHIAKSALKILQNQSSNCEGDVDAQYQNLAELWNMNHCLLASIGVSHPALESVRTSADKFGLACKLTGAGGGGYAIVLVPRTANQKVIDDLTKELADKGFKVIDTALGGPGVQYYV